MLCRWAAQELKVKAKRVSANKRASSRWHFDLVPVPSLTYDIGVPVQREDALARGGAGQAAHTAAHYNAGRVPWTVAAHCGTTLRLVQGTARAYCCLLLLRLWLVAAVETLASWWSQLILLPARGAQLAARVIAFPNRFIARSRSRAAPGGAVGCIRLIRADLQRLRLIATRWRRFIQGVAHCESLARFCYNFYYFYKNICIFKINARSFFFEFVWENFACCRLRQLFN